jgi:hypothetical protein
MEEVSLKLLQHVILLCELMSRWNFIVHSCAFLYIQRPGMVIYELGGNRARYNLLVSNQFI